jgi:hypothetical protein
MPNDFADKDAHLTIAAATVPDLVTSSMNPADWLEATADTPLTFRAHDAGPASGITFRPLYDVHHQRYSSTGRCRRRTRWAPHERRRASAHELGEQAD